MASSLSFLKQAGRVVNKTLSAASAQTFTPARTIQGLQDMPETTEEEFGKVIKVMEQQGYITTQSGPNGIEIKLTESGDTMRSNFFTEK